MANRCLVEQRDLPIVRELYLEQQFGTPYIANQMGCSGNTVYRFLKKNGISIRRQEDAASLIHYHPIIKRPARPRTFSDAVEKQFAQQYQIYGVNASTIARENNCHKVVILNALRRHGVQMKSRKELLGDKFNGENNPNYGNHDAIAGARNKNWVADRTALKTNLHESIRKSHEYTVWRRGIFQRDDYTCVLCKKRGGYLEVHHLVTLREIIAKYQIQSYETAVNCSELFDISNGVTMCRSCHDKTKWKESYYYNELKGAINL